MSEMSKDGKTVKNNCQTRQNCQNLKDETIKRRNVRFPHESRRLLGNFFHVFVNLSVSRPASSSDPPRLSFRAAWAAPSATAWLRDAPPAAPAPAVAWPASAPSTPPSAPAAARPAGRRRAAGAARWAAAPGSSSFADSYAYVEYDG